VVQLIQYVGYLIKLVRSTHHTANSSHSQVVKRSTRHTVNSSHVMSWWCDELSGSLLTNNKLQYLQFHPVFHSFCQLFFCLTVLVTHSF